MKADEIHAVTPDAPSYPQACESFFPVPTYGSCTGSEPRSSRRPLFVATIQKHVFDSVVGSDSESGRIRVPMPSHSPAINDASPFLLPDGREGGLVATPTEKEGEGGWKMSASVAGGGGRRGATAEAAGEKKEPFHVIHKVPSGDSPYVRAKHLQLVEKDPEASIVWFWKAINAGDRVDSALKDMAVVMKQQDRVEEAVEAIKSFRHLCSKQAQESLDNVLIDLYKKCGRAEEQIELLKHKLKMIYMGEAFNGKTTKTARSHGKKFQVSIKQETTRILGNLGWAYMQQTNYVAAEVVYCKAQEIEPDANKACNLALCLMGQHRYEEARGVLEDVRRGRLPGSDDPKTSKRAEELQHEIESQLPSPSPLFTLPVEEQYLEEDIVGGMDLVMSNWTPFRAKRLPIFEEISTYVQRDQIAC